MNGSRPGRVVARYRDGRGLCAENGWGKADRNRQGVSRPNRERVRQYLGAANSAVEEAIPVTEREHLPLLLRTNGSSANEPTQTLPKKPLLAITRLSRGGGHSPETAILCGPAGSLLKTVTVPAVTPCAVGSNRITDISGFTGPDSHRIRDDIGRPESRRGRDVIDRAASPDLRCSASVSRPGTNPGIPVRNRRGSRSPLPAGPAHP